jgi:ribosomal protein L11 methyltransferase
VDALAQRILAFIAASPDKVHFAELMCHLGRHGRAGARQVKGAVADLVAAGQLCYTSHYGSSYIESAYDRPILVSRHVVIKPPGTKWQSAPGQCSVNLERGAAFGGGEHPTTRMAIDLIDDLLHHPEWRLHKHTLQVIDIGTGSGVLALVAAALGVSRVHAIDTDPCAVFEARRNIFLNRLQDRITIAQDDQAVLSPAYDIVIANLRTPTLLSLRHFVRKNNADRCALVFSGLKTDEVAGLCLLYRKGGYWLYQNRVEKGWSAICLIRGALSSEKAPGR